MIISILSALKGQKTITLIITFVILVTPFMIVLRSNMDIYNGTDSRELLLKSAAMLRSIQEKLRQTIPPFQPFISQTPINNRRIQRQPNLSKKVPLYIITPTYPRPVQLPELTRLSTVLMNVENIHWIIADDTNTPTEAVLQLLNDVKIRSHYLLSPMPEEYRNKSSTHWPKGVANRLAGLDWIYNHTKTINDTSGVLYFADDDNTYDIRLFDELRKTKTVSAFPVGIVGGQFVSTPLLDENGKFVRFFEGWVGGRKYALDMAGFAVNVEQYVKRAKIFKDKNQPIMAFRRGFEEDDFLRNINVEPKDFQFPCDNCTKIYVWHTKTQKPTVKQGYVLTEKEMEKTNLGKLNSYWCLYFGNHRCDEKSKNGPSPYPKL